MCIATGERVSQGMKNDRSSVIWREGQSTVVGSIHMHVEGTVVKGMEGKVCYGGIDGG